MFMEYTFGRDSGIWAESSEKWDDAHPCWKIVGHDPRRILRDRGCLQDMEMFHRSSIEHIFEYEYEVARSAADQRRFYVVVFTSGKACTAVSRFRIDTGAFVIIEADRGEDCVQVRERAAGPTGDMKTVLRKAVQKDIEVLERKKAQEIKAMEKCNGLVREKSLPMEITGCEFQWDMKKITFYFRSDKRVDFRELVNELFKYFKVRIWMSMENRK